MRNRSDRVLAAVAVVVMAALVWHDADAAQRHAKKSRTVRELLEAPKFSDSGEFSGLLSGEFSLNGASYRLAPDATLYEIGRGPLPAGTAVNSRMVSVSGLVRKNRKIVYQVMVRPERTIYSGTADLSESVRVDESERPR